MDKEKKNVGPSGPSGNDQVDQLLRKLNPEMKRAKPGPEALAAALEAVERLAAEADAADAADDLEQKLAVEPGSTVCIVCGYRNREQNLSWRDQLGSDETIVDGRWITDDPAHPEAKDYLARATQQLTSRRL